MKKIRKIWRKPMTRPAVYMTFTRFVESLFAVLLADFLYVRAGGQSVKALLFTLAGVVFAALAFIAYLRMDGVKLPKMMMLRLNPRRKKTPLNGDIIDYVDEEPTTQFEDLEDEEKDVCILLADLICCVVFLGISLFV